VKKPFHEAFSLVCTVVVDGFFGDGGKGKLVSYLTVADEVAVCARGGVGPNAGHTVVSDGVTFKLRMVPCGFVNNETRLLIGAGVVVNPEIVIKEVKELGIEDRFGIDPQCAIIEAKHIVADGKGHLKDTIGTTGTGTGPCNADRALRVAKIAKEIPELQEYLSDVSLEINEALDCGANVLLEGTQGTYISLYHGTYPFVTSNDVCASAICSDVGVGPTKVDEVILVLKAYVTRVGEGFLPGEISHEEAKNRGWDEYGTVTGRQRRAAPFNFELARRAIILNGATQIALTKLDILFPECKGSSDYDTLNGEAMHFVEYVEKELCLPVTFIGTGPGVWEIIDRRK
jgi:adenylosuccinate synthase|tara:strand:- start:527 stop:1558 length:1032 start_codon:yes stop_codon:yes gene_type:complete